MKLQNKNTAAEKLDMVTYFVVQSFTRGKRGALLPDSPMQARDSNHAQRIVDRLAKEKVGVVAFSRDGDPDAGEYSEPRLLAIQGTVPEEVHELQSA